jgi:hypothetical protein
VEIWKCYFFLIVEKNHVCFYRNIDDVDKTMDEINDNMENMRQIQDLLSAPMGAAADFDEVSPLCRRHTLIGTHALCFCACQKEEENPNLFCFE